jgi:hypothetical protein
MFYAYEDFPMAMASTGPIHEAEYCRRRGNESHFFTHKDRSETRYLVSYSFMNWPSGEQRSMKIIFTNGCVAVRLFLMSRTAEQVLEQIKDLPASGLKVIWKRVSRLVADDVSEAEFEAALDDITGCTAGSNSGQRLLEERRRDLEQDQAFLAARSKERGRA